MSNIAIQSPLPNQVLEKPTVEEQIKEMVQWFKAFQANDYSKRDYRKYFKVSVSKCMLWQPATLGLKVLNFNQAILLGCLGT